MSGARRSGRAVRPAYAVVLVGAAALAAACGAGSGAGSQPPAAPPRTSQASPSAPAPVGHYAFPVAAETAAYHRTHAGYPGTDIFADCGTPVVAVTDGRILEISRTDRYSADGPQGPFNGGLAVSLLGDDGVRYYGSHLGQIAPGIDPGVRVRAGQRLGTVGRTGNANNVCHLHFGISPPCGQAQDWWIRRGVIWPASYLDAWRRNRPVSPAAAVRAWQRERGCPPTP
ncbi:MAG TPA: M23 family metallopeptidase [Micromonosporaceae bacterium]|nr:M23 family metallopeptidase [Micromonosporaceae bacterium]